MIPYKTVSNNTGSLNSGSFNDPTVSSVICNDPCHSGEVWYGFSEADVIELSVYDTSQTLLGWNITNQEKNYKTVSLSYLDDKEIPQRYSYEELLNEFILYKNSKILVNPIEELSSSFSILNGSYTVSYLFTREMAGDPSDRLIIKEVSPSRKELKLLPINGNPIRYQAFCHKKFQLKDVAPLVLRLSKDCPYDKIYRDSKNDYKSEIALIKHLFFLSTDGQFTDFLRFLYEDLVTYSTTQTTRGDSIISQEGVRRIQGIRTYFTNYLLSNYEEVGDFNLIKEKFDEYCHLVINKKFAPFGNAEIQEYNNAKQYVFDVFTKYFYYQISDYLSKTYNSKYYSYLKNGLNFGLGRILPMLNHGFIDERIESDDPLTLVLKLQEELPSDILAGSECWVSNISMIPFLMDIVLRNPSDPSLISIGRPNFSLQNNNATIANDNTLHTYESLSNELVGSNDIQVNKKLNELEVDYDDFNNFVVFSSAELRLSLFKNKIIQLGQLSASLATLETKNSQSLAAGDVYSHYYIEKGTIQGQVNEIYDSFDGYESYLYRSGSYTYNLEAGEFVSASYVEDKDEAAVQYDKRNRDSLLANTPQHVIQDSENNDYVVFLSMIGHYFDNLYLYIQNLPSQKSLKNSSGDFMTKKMTEYLLENFGWNVDDFLELDGVSRNYLNNEQQPTFLSTISGDERVRQIRNRILQSLPTIYKQKGSEEAIKNLLTCYGIPAALLSVKEYGSLNYSEQPQFFIQQERVYMTRFPYQTHPNGNRPYINLQSNTPNNRTVEFKFSVENSELYRNFRRHVLFAQYTTPTPEAYDWSIGIYKVPGKNLGRVYMEYEPESSSSLYKYSPVWEPNNRIVLSSSLLPIFDGNIYSVMVRRNYPDPGSEYSYDDDNHQLRYDLYVQRNEYGRRIAYSTSSVYLTGSYNGIFSRTGMYQYGSIWNETSNPNNPGPFYGTLDKVMIWNPPITDDDFEDHVNDYNSYVLSQTSSYGDFNTYPKQVLLPLRVTFDYPIELHSSTGVTNFSNSNDYFGAVTNTSSLWTLNEFPTDMQVWYTTSFTMNSCSAYNFPLMNVSTRIDPTCYCNEVTTSIYPYSFKVFDVPVTYPSHKYGPNVMQNEKVRKFEYSLEARLDTVSRSTWASTGSIAFNDSNRIGIFADPQKHNNEEIVKYFGREGIVESIGDPSLLFSDKYTDLVKQNYQFSKYMRRKILFGELFSLYRMYFNRSVFDAIKNIVPARSSTLVGILVEPTMIERPKYQYKPLESDFNTSSSLYLEANVRRYSSTKESGSYVRPPTVGFSYINFALDTSSMVQSYFDSGSIPNNYVADYNLSYVSYPNGIYPRRIGGNYFPDVMDGLQRGHYAITDTSGSHGKLAESDMNVEEHFSGSYPHFLLKRWTKYTAYYKTGNWTRTNDLSDNLYQTGSVWLYDFISVTKPFYSSVVYTSSVWETSGSVGSTPSNIYADMPDFSYFHGINTMVGTPNQKRGNIQGTKVRVGPPSSTDYSFESPYYYLPSEQYLEVFNGYPRNHYTHKRGYFAPERYTKLGTGKNMRNVVSQYTKGRQTVSTTINEDGLEDGSLPVETIVVSNVKITPGDNVIGE